MTKTDNTVCYINFETDEVYYVYTVAYWLIDYVYLDKLTCDTIEFQNKFMSSNLFKSIKSVLYSQSALT